jgi:hypothetical protein
MNRQQLFIVLIILLTFGILLFFILQAVYFLHVTNLDNGKCMPTSIDCNYAKKQSVPSYDKNGQITGYEDKMTPACKYTCIYMDGSNTTGYIDG